MRFSALCHRLLWAVLTVTCLTIPMLAQTLPASQEKKGKFLVFLKGRPVGTETFTVGPNELNGEVSLDMGIKVLAKTHILYQENNLKLLEVEQNNSKLTVDCSKNPVVLTGPGGSRTINVPPGTILLESVFMHHYHTLVERYDQQKSGKQTFQALVPSAGMVVPIEIELKSRLETRIIGRQMPLLKFDAKASGLLDIFITTDENLNILMVDVPVQSFTAVREGFETLLPKPEPKLANDAYESLDVSVPSGGGVTLAGTLTLPKKGNKPFPAVVLITGSGPQDRDEDTPPMLNTHLFRLIADKLSSQGIAVLRCDDRGVAKSTGDFSQLTLSDLVADATAQVKYLRSRPDINPKRISVLGHSEGGYVAPMVAAADPAIHSVVILAGPSRPLDMVMVEQLAFQANHPDLPKEVQDVAKSLIEPTNQMIAAVKANQPKEKDGRKIAQIGRLVWNFDYFRQHFTHNPTATIRKVKCPVLILQGEKDLLVQPYHALALEKELKRAGNKQVQVKLFPYLTHMYTTFPHNNPDPQAMSKVNTVSEDFLQALLEWGVKTF
ncbi:MAG: alpha/beta fold hydrolase [Blastocatellia bacterium]|nr:alpha/beta fold hydrolase [Blastocatellia bacterium]